MRRPRLPVKGISQETINSALGITRISHVTVSQVLHATPSDISILKSHMNSWNVPNFQSYPLLIRALTHPSISNWAERILNLPKRSLGPKTMELLGDSVVGTSVAQHILNWLRIPNSCPSLIQWTGSARTLLPTLVSNRGMALTSRRIGIERLMRWEKSTPPTSHRLRLDELGVETTTGLQSNVEINALAAAFESTTAAIFLDGGMIPVNHFLQSSLLDNPALIQRANRESSEYEQQLLQQVVTLFGQPVQFIRTRPGNHHPTVSSPPLSPSYQPIILELLDLQQKPSEQISQAHALFFSAVSIRRRPSPSSSSTLVTSNSNNHNSRVVNATVDVIDDQHVISVASHFSVEMARIAALTQAMAILRGEIEHNATTTSTSSSNSTRRNAHWKTDSIITRQIPGVGPINGCRNVELTTHFDESGRWRYDADYTHASNVLKRAGLRAFSAVSDNNSNPEQIRNRLRALRAQTKDEMDFGEFQKMPSVHMLREEELLDEDTTTETNTNTALGALPRRRFSSSYDDIMNTTLTSHSNNIPNHNNSNNNNNRSFVDPSIVQDCIESGIETLFEQSELHKTYETILDGAVTDGSTIVHALNKQVAQLDTLDRPDRLKLLLGLHSLGHQASRLWAVQTSMRDVAQDLGQVVPTFETRTGLCTQLQRQLVGDDGLASIREGGIKKAYVAIGMCVDAVGMPTATAWLSGAEKQEQSEK